MYILSPQKGICRGGGVGVYKIRPRVRERERETERENLQAALGEEAGGNDTAATADASAAAMTDSAGLPNDPVSRLSEELQSLPSWTYPLDATPSEPLLPDPIRT